MSDKKQALLILALTITMIFTPPLNEPDYLQGLANWLPTALITFLCCVLAWCLIMDSEIDKELK